MQRAIKRPHLLAIPLISGTIKLTFIGTRAFSAARLVLLGQPGRALFLSLRFQRSRRRRSCWSILLADGRLVAADERTFCFEFAREGGIRLAESASASQFAVPRRH